MNPAMKRRQQTRQQQLDAAEAAADSLPPDNSAGAVSDDAADTAPDSAVGSPQRNDQAARENDLTPPPSPQEEGGSAARPAPEAPTAENYARLQGKSAALEKSNAELMRELAALKAQQQTPPPPVKTEAEKQAELETALRQEYGDDWDYWDDAQRSFAKQLYLKNNPQAVEQRVNQILEQRDQQRRDQSFHDTLDRELATQGTTLAALVNDPDFAAWANKSRRRLAIWDDAMKYRDDEAKTDVLALYAEFRNQGVVDKGNHTTPAVRASAAKAAPKAEAVITEEQYLQALRDKRHPRRRDAARKTIDAYEAQQGKT